MMEGILDEAERRYEDAKGLSTIIGFQEGVEKAKENLKELKKRQH